jgi:hypothetical protein
LKREIALCELERTFADATEAAEQVRPTLASKVDSLRQEKQGRPDLACSAQKAGSDHLARIAPAQDGAPDENPRARLRRKVQELANILASAEILSAELARARSRQSTLLERQNHSSKRTRSNLAPAWRQGY